MSPRSSNVPGGVFLTGATGFVGQYLLKDALATDMPIAVMVRPDGRASGQTRIEGILQNWEKRLGRRLVRPVVLEGCLRERHLGLSHVDRVWLQRHCSIVVHSAASVKFEAGDETTEPWLTNVEGTRHLLEACGEIGLRKFHHISTAYVSGLRSGRILETELDVGQEFSNDYERSKCDAEQLVRRAKHLEVATISRPSIVVGDSNTGHTTTFRGLYAPLQLIYLYAMSNPRRELPLLSTLGLSGSEGKNLVPVDWVSRVIWHLTHSSNSTGRTFHLTNPQPVRICELMDAVRSVIDATDANVDPNPAVAATRYLDDHFRDTLEVYKAYLRNDAEFDSVMTTRFAPADRCPVLDRQRLVKLVSYAIEQRFTPPRTRVKSATHVEQRLRAVAPDVSATTVAADDWLQLELSGPGGGTWQIGYRDEAFVCLDRGAKGGASASVYGSAETFSAFINGQLTLVEALEWGSLVVRGNGRPVDDCLRLLARLQKEMSGEYVSP